MKSFHSPLIEPLEARIAPASLTLVNSTTATYQDIDGDKVTVKISKGLFTDQAALNAVAQVNIFNELALNLNSLGQTAKGLSISIDAKKTPGNLGDGLTEVAFISAQGIDLGTVKVDGSLDHLTAGSGAAKGGVASLSVDSLEWHNFGFVPTEIAGKLGALNVKHNVDQASVHATAGLGSVKIGGDLIGGGVPGTGKISSDGAMGNVTIGGALKGGTGDYSGLIQGNGPTGTVKIAKSIEGGAGTSSGAIYTSGKLAGVNVGDSIIGGDGNYSGSVRAVGDIGSVKIAQDLKGSSTAGTLFSAYLRADSIKTVTIGGDFESKPGNNGSIVAVHALGSVKIKGNLEGVPGITGNNPIVISAGGAVKPTATKDLSIASVTIDGNLTNAIILAGYKPDSLDSLSPVNEDASIGSIVVKGNWSASSVAAGVKDVAVGGARDGFGRNDALIGGGDALIISKIASITIKGSASGKPGGGASNFFGITAQAVGKLQIGGEKVALTAGKDNMVLDAVNANFKLVEL